MNQFRNESQRTVEFQVFLEVIIGGVGAGSLRQRQTRGVQYRLEAEEE